MNLVAVSRILNEDDIIESFVRHHAELVDHHLFLDNGSTDDTLRILRDLKTEGLQLTVLQNKAPFFTEVSYNTSLFRQAVRLYSADWVVF
ncbi:MAG TPA: glycosyltransferase family 2 protein, partial [Alphaproteobacteria bacterium]|nr:glycosyltransferase family 2 protein [Alphaproteobacteria bacterium]